MSYMSSTATDQVVLSEEEKARIAQRARLDLLKVLLSQFVSVLAVSLVFGLVSGVGSALSVLLGAFCYLAPNAVFVLRLLLATYKPQGAGAGTFLVGNALKVLVALGLLWLLADLERGRLDWLAAVIGLIAALKGYWLGLLFTGGKLGK